MEPPIYEATPTTPRRRSQLWRWGALCLALAGLGGATWLWLGAGARPAQATWIDPPQDWVTIRLQTPARNNVFYADEPVRFTVAPLTNGTKAPVVGYEVRDYYGRVVRSGAVMQSTIDLKTLLPGWYKLDVFSSMVRPTPYRDAAVSTTICVFRRDPHFPARPAPDAKGQPVFGGSFNHDGIVRGLLGLGPERHQADVNNLDENYKRLDADLAIDTAYYAKYRDPLNLRPLLITFGNGTKDHDAQVSQVVRRYKKQVSTYETRNEPQDTPAAEFVRGELTPFRNAVLAADPQAHLIGPSVVGLNEGQLGWLDQFFQAGGANQMDGFSFHAYNAVNGDLALGRRSLNGLRDVMRRNNVNLPLWQTEQGYAAPIHGVYTPRHQGRWTMLQRLLFDSYGLPKERDVWWYDKSHGFWDFPHWIVNDDTSLNPMAPLMRVYSEETWGKKWVGPLHFGASADNRMLGNLYRGPQGGVAALMSAGATSDAVRVVTDPTVRALTVVSAFGIVSRVPVVKGAATLPVSELPRYVRLAPNQKWGVVPFFAPNLARLPGATITADGGTSDEPRLHNGQMETWYWAQSGDMKDGPSAPWNIHLDGRDTLKNPVNIDVTFPTPRPVRRVVLYATTPHQYQCAPLDWALQYRDARGAWRTLKRFTEPTNVVPRYTPFARCAYDLFYSERWIWDVDFPPVQTTQLRAVFYDVSLGGMPTHETSALSGGAESGGQRLLTLREIEVYGS